MDAKDELLFNALWKSYYPLLRKYAQMLLKDETLEKNVVNDVYFMVARKLPVLMSHPSPAGWLIDFLKSTILRTMEEDARHSEIFSSEKEAQQALSQHLPPSITEWDKWLLAARYIELRTLSEICATCKISTAKCKIDLYDARRRVEGVIHFSANPQMGGKNNV